ncbi:MAG TPA: TraR/DksA C4-type zinc finger protein [Aliidongia sp.]|nr:TraR/DksA C4-type zinc finger protein [Aliidongia sp.]
MADEIDKAQARDEEFRADALASWARRAHGAVVPAPELPRDCLACGDEIPIERLKALPAAIFCRDCQDRQERRPHEPRQYP